MIRVSAVVLLLAGCSYSTDGPQFIVVDSFGTVVVRMDDKEKAYRTSEKLTLMGRVLASKPQYFVIDSRETQKDE